jgi:hypothetical protein
MEANHTSGARIEVPRKIYWMRILRIEVSHKSETLNDYFNLAIKNGLDFNPLVSATSVKVIVE